MDTTHHTTLSLTYIRPPRASVKDMRAKAALRQKRYRQRKQADAHASHSTRYVVHAVADVRQWADRVQYFIVWQDSDTERRDRTGWYDMESLSDADRGLADRIILRDTFLWDRALRLCVCLCWRCRALLWSI